MSAAHGVARGFHLNTVRHRFNVLAPETAPSLEPAFLEFPGSRLIRLPATPLPEVSVRRALEDRSSCRSFSDEAIGLDELSTLLRFGYGVLGQARLGDLEMLDRPVPSGGGLYPLELFVLPRLVADLDARVHHYMPLHHALEELAAPLPPERSLADLFLDQPYATRCGAIVVFAAILERSMAKYGDRGYRYILLEAGHAAQNVALVASALGIGCLSLGGFFDVELAALLGLRWPTAAPLYAVALGRMAVPEKHARRNLF